MSIIFCSCNPYQIFCLLHFFNTSSYNIYLRLYVHVHQLFFRIAQIEQNEFWQLGGSTPVNSEVLIILLAPKFAERKFGLHFCHKQLAQVIRVCHFV